VCVIWPFHFDQRVGFILGGLAALGGLIDYVVKLTRRLRSPAKKAQPEPQETK
jgi:hypothetical protein